MDSNNQTIIGAGLAYYNELANFKHERDSVSSKYPNTDENMIQSVWIANETLSCVFDISSQSKQKLWSKLRCKIVKIYSN